MEETDNIQPAIREDSGRNEDGTFKKGVSGNPSGRPKNTLKDYDRRRFNDMSDEEKENFLKTIPNEVRYKMAEGNPHQTTDANLSGTVQIVFDPTFNALTPETETNRS